MDTFEIQGKIQDIKRYSQNKAGQQYIDDYGNPYQRVTIQIDRGLIPDPQFRGYISYLDNSNLTNDWKIGDYITGTVTKKTGAGGKIYWNFATNAEQEKTSPSTQVSSGGEVPKEPLQGVTSQNKTLESIAKSLEVIARILEEKTSNTSEPVPDSDKDLPF
jgi:hypothetical protein